MGSKRKGAPARRIASWGSAGEELVSEQVPRSRRGRSSALGLPRTLLEASNSRSNNLDFIRVVMASLVILTHAFDVFIETKLPEPLTFLTRGQLTSGAFAVGVFFLVSGYLVTASWRNSKSVFDFFRKRVLRVHPGFIVSCAICLLVVGPIAASDVGAYYSEISPLRFITDALLLEVVDMPPAFEAPYSVNGTLWMIQIEFLCYVLLGIIGGARLLNQGIVTLGIVVAWALMALPLFPAVFSRLPAQGTIAFLNSHFRFATFFFHRRAGVPDAEPHSLSAFLGVWCARCVRARRSYGHWLPFVPASDGLPGRFRRLLPGSSHRRLRQEAGPLLRHLSLRLACSVHLSRLPRAPDEPLSLFAHLAAARVSRGSRIVDLRRRACTPTQAPDFSERASTGS
jgi:hypothetical protein